MAPAAYSLGATPPLKQRDKSSFRFGRSGAGAAQPLEGPPSPLDSPPRPTQDQQTPTAGAKPGFFRRLAGAGAGGGKNREEDGTGRIPWETSSSPAVLHKKQHGKHQHQQRERAEWSSPPASPASRRPPPPPPPPSHDDRQYKAYPPPPASSSRSLHSPTTRAHRQPYQHHHPHASSTGSSDGYSLLFASGIHNIRKRAADEPAPASAALHRSAASREMDDDDLVSEGEDRAHLSPKKGFRELVKKGSKFSLRSLVHAHGHGHPGAGGATPPDSPTRSQHVSTGGGGGGGSGTSPQTQSLPLPSSGSALAGHGGYGFPPRRPSVSSPRSARYPVEISSPVSRPPLSPAASAPSFSSSSYLTPLPSPRERKLSSTSAATSMWALGGGGEEAPTGKGSVRGKAARLLGEEVVPSGKAAKILGMERKKTVVKKPSAVSLRADSVATSFDRRPSVATTLSAGTYDSPPSSFPSTPGLDTVRSVSSVSTTSKSLKRRSVSDPNLLLSQHHQHQAQMSSASLPPSTPSPPQRAHRNLYEDDDWLWDATAPSTSQTPSPKPTLTTLAEVGPSTTGGLPSPPETSDYAGSSPDYGMRDSVASSTFAFPSSRTSTAGMRDSTIEDFSPSSRVLSLSSVASSSYGIPSTYYPFSISPPPFSPTGLPTPSASHAPGAGSHALAVFTTLDPGASWKQAKRLSPDSIRFSALGVAMGPDAFNTPPRSDSPGSSAASAAASNRTSSAKRPSLGPRGLSASSMGSSSAASTPTSGKHLSLSSSSRHSSSPLPPPPTLPPALPPPPAPLPSSTRPTRSNTLVSVASSHTRRFERTNALEALEGRTVGGAGREAEEAGRGGRKRALEARAGAGRGGPLQALQEETPSRPQRRDRRAAVRESRPFLDLDFSSSDEDEAERESGLEAVEEEQEERRARERSGESTLSAHSSATRTSGSARSRASSSAASLSLGGAPLPPPRSPLPTPPPPSALPPSVAAVTLAPLASLPPAPRSAPPAPPLHPYSRPISPPSSSLPPTPSFSSSSSDPRRLPTIPRTHNRALSAASYASMSSTSSSLPSSSVPVFLVPPQQQQRPFSAMSGGSTYSDSDLFSTFSATERMFPVPPSTMAGGGHTLPFAMPPLSASLPPSRSEPVMGKLSAPPAGSGDEEYRFPPPRTSSRQALNDPFPVPPTGFRNEQAARRQRESGDSFLRLSGRR
ncbi:hypothetical protein JCM8097_006832 [Rhodosporidiobolus ruineniae]